MKAGLLLLTGGLSRRMGAPKHALPHPAGGSWGGQVVRVFRSVFPAGPVQVLGEPLPDLPDLDRLEDPREGPAVALETWARTEVPDADRWWIVACDQVRWTPEALEAWARACRAADPAAELWVMARCADHLQPLGSWLPAALRPALAAAQERSLMGLAQSLPHLALEQAGSAWADLDTPAERRAWESEEG